jgi:hypothetical protein
MIILGYIKLIERAYFGNDGFIKCLAFVQLFFVMFRFLFLLGVMVKDHAAVLRSNIVALPVECCRVMALPECLKQFIKSYFCRVVYYLNNLRMTCSTFANLFIGGFFNMAATVASDFLLAHTTTTKTTSSCLPVHHS